MCSVLEENYPDLLEHFFNAGARKVSFEDSIPDHLRPQYMPEPGDEKMWVLMCRRATMETVLRKYVTQTTSVTIKNRISVTDIIINENDRQDVVLEGLRVVDHENNNEKSEMFSDIVIDSTGRSSKFSKWLSNCGIEITEERDDAEIVYYTRHYCLKDGVPEPPRDAKKSLNGRSGLHEVRDFSWRWRTLRPNNMFTN
jgi:flavin-dependent dehydrogenase